MILLFNSESEQITIPELDTVYTIDNMNTYLNYRPAYKVDENSTGVYSYINAMFVTDPNMNHLGTPSIYTDHTYQDSYNLSVCALETATTNLNNRPWSDKEDDVESYVIPNDCTTILIEAWGAGGGSGGSWSTGTNGAGGAGGYATTTLTVGVDVLAGEIIYCATGKAGIGGPALFHGGWGGEGTAVWVGNYFDYNSSKFKESLSTSTAVLIAGGGGGGGAINWSIGTAGSGGSGGYAHSGNGGAESGSNTGATTSSHGAGLITAVEGITNGTYDAGDCDDDGTEYPEASFGSLLPVMLMSVYVSDYGGSLYMFPAGGGGGAFCGSNSADVYVTTQSYVTGRGGGAGSNKVYKGSSSSTSTSSISSTPPNSGSSGGRGYGGTGKGPYPTTNEYTGVSGTGGRIKITFNS